jgi:hypothetical protein
MAATKEMN